jgi:aspartate 1-decarboxylase
MQRCFLQGKIHRLRVTDSKLDYEGSLTLDSKLIEAAGFYPYEKVDIYNISNGARFSTYIIQGEGGTGVVCTNGAAARLAQPGDLVIVAGYVYLDEAEAMRGKVNPSIVHVDDRNRIMGKKK